MSSTRSRPSLQGRAVPQLPRRELAAQPDVLSVELLRRAKLKGYSGSKSALYALVTELRPRRPRVVRFEGLPGEFSQHDFGDVDVQFLDGRKQRVHFFASRLKYSRWVQVSLVDNEQVEALVRAMVEHFAWGQPAAARGVRPGQDHRAELEQGRVVTKWNPSFGAVMLDLGVGVELCWPQSPEQKGAVREQVVGPEVEHPRSRNRRRSPGLARGNTSPRA
jgi:transposase